MSEHSPRKYKIMLMILPVGVVIGTIVFMVAYFKMERDEERQRAVIASYGLRVEDLSDMVGKLTDRIGPRDHGSESGRRGMKQASAMIEGRLGPQNVGYKVEKGGGEAIGEWQWKSLWVDIEGRSAPEEVIIVAASYAGEGQDADATCLSTVVMLASAMARKEPARTLRFVFLPIAQSPNLQNQWILKHCLGADEQCVGILGLQTMDEAPTAGGDEWQLWAPDDRDRVWWDVLRGRSSGAPEISGASVWLGASVFSPQAWQDRRHDRLQRTVSLASELQSWLLSVASAE
ncbi:hypothetical protein [Oceaniferula marina]|nr:hypothetical protein [Oceaniferula marina]